MPSPRPTRPARAPTSRPRPTRAATGIDLRALEIFVAVVETGSMTAAAKRLSVTQPAVSLAVAQLEKRWKARCSTVRRGRCGPTSAGVVLLRRALRLLADMARAARPRSSTRASGRCPASASASSPRSPRSARR